MRRGASRAAEHTLGVVILAALVVYALSAGADYGGRMWTCWPSGLERHGSARRSSTHRADWEATTSGWVSRNWRRSKERGSRSGKSRPS